MEYSTYLIKDFDTNGLELDRERISFEAIIKGEALHSATRQSSRNFDTHENYIQDDDFPLDDAGTIGWDLGITEKMTRTTMMTITLLSKEEG